jgi:hypothetical protein
MKKNDLEKVKNDLSLLIFEKVFGDYNLDVREYIFALENVLPLIMDKNSTLKFKGS